MTEKQLTDAFEALTPDRKALERLDALKSLPAQSAPRPVSTVHSTTNNTKAEGK